MRISDWSSDVCSSDLAVQDERECPILQDLIDEPAHDIVIAAQGPEQPGQRDVDPDQCDGQEADITSEPSEGCVDVGDECLQEAVDVVEIVPGWNVLRNERGRGAGPGERSPAPRRTTVGGGTTVALSGGATGGCRPSRNRGSGWWRRARRSRPGHGVPDRKSTRLNSSH